MKELIDLSKLKTWLITAWGKYIGYVLCLGFGIVIGAVAVEGRIVDDCRYLNKFRFGSQVFNCGRVM